MRIKKEFRHWQRYTRCIALAWLVAFVLPLCNPHWILRAFAVTTASSITISPNGASWQYGGTQTFTATCHYASDPDDNCALAGGVTYSSSAPSTMVTINSSTGVAAGAVDPGAGGLVNTNGTALTWVSGNKQFDSSWVGLPIYVNGGTYTITNWTDATHITISSSAGVHSSVTWNLDGGWGWAWIIATASGVTGRAGAFIQHAGDIGWNIYPEPAGSGFELVVGSTAQMGVGLTVPRSSFGANFICTFSSSNPSVATVNSVGLITAVSAGTATIACGLTGNAIFSNGGGSTGNTIFITVINGGSGNQDWYVRTDGGTPFSAALPSGQCDGKSDLAAAGATSHHCAFGEFKWLYMDDATSGQLQWIITGGDAVIVRGNENTNTGYSLNLTSYSGQNTPINCAGNGANNCFMPHIPSGTSAQHTRILGENYANCKADSAKVVLNGTWGAFLAFNLSDTQDVDVQCFQIAEPDQCGGNNNFTNHCVTGTNNYVQYGIVSSSLSSNINLVDLWIHNIAQAPIVRPSADSTLVLTRVHVQGGGSAGWDQDASDYSVSSISVSGGLTIRDSIFEFAGCVMEYPIVHTYPYIECRGQGLNGYGDEIATANAIGDWVITGTTIRYSMQDGFDSVHGGLANSYTLSNDYIYGNVGSQFKLGPTLGLTAINDKVIENCQRLAEQLGDMPTIPTGENWCRAGGIGIGIELDQYGTYNVQDWSYASYGDISFNIICAGGPLWEDCSRASGSMKNMNFVGYADSNYNLGMVTSLFYNSDGYPVPPNFFATRSYNYFYNVRSCPTLQTGETCTSMTPPGIIDLPATPITAEAQMDPINFGIQAGSNLLGAGVNIGGITTDYASNPRPSAGQSNSSIGAYELVPPAPSGIGGGTLKGGRWVRNRATPFGRIILETPRSAPPVTMRLDIGGSGTGAGGSDKNIYWSFNPSDSRTNPVSFINTESAKAKRGP